MLSMFHVLPLLGVLGLSCSAAAVAPPAVKTNAVRQVTLLHVADLHAQLEEHPELFWEGGVDRIEMAGGFARLSKAIETIREERPGGVMLLDGGDTLQGSGAAALTQGAVVLGPLAALGLDVGVPGNWEVVYGPDVLRERAKQMKHPLIAANIRDARTGARVFAPTLVREVGGVRIGVIGYTDPDVPRRQSPSYSEGFRYEGPEALSGLAQALREDQGAEVVILLSHIGLSKAVALSRHLPGIDVHLSADTHERTYRPIDVDGTWVVEPGAFGSFLGRLDLTLSDGQVVDRRWELMELTASRFAEDPKVLASVKAALRPLDGVLSATVGHTDATLARYDVLETNADNLLADALRDATGTEIALSNGFRFAAPILRGPIREADLWNLLPVVTQLKTGKVLGSQLRAFWEQELENVFADDASRRFGGWLPRPSGMTIRFAAQAPNGQRVREIRVGGALLEDDRLYTVTACEREGDADDRLCRIDGVKEARVLSVNAHEAVRSYLRDKGHVAPAREGRVVGIDLPGALRSQALEAAAR